MAINIPILFSIAGGLIIIGFLSNEFFYKIKIPEALILIFIGILLGPVFHVFDPGSFLSFSGVMASIAIMVIMFEAGLTLDIRRVVSEAPKSFMFATAYYTLSVVLVSIITTLLTGWPYIYGLLVGALLSGTSAAVVIPLLRQLNIEKDEAVVLELESTITNIYIMILTLSFVRIIVEGETTDIALAINQILGAFTISAVIAALVGYAWLRTLKKLQQKPFSYMLTLAVLLFLYAFLEYIGASGPLGALVFGLVLSNVHVVSPLRTVHLIQLHTEISFFIRVFFFVFLGVIFQISDNPILWLLAVFIGLISMLSRFIAAKLMEFKHVDLFTTLIPRGLGEAVLASLILDYGVEHAMEILQLTSLVIIVTNVMTAAAIFYILRRAQAETSAQPQAG